MATVIDLGEVGGDPQDGPRQPWRSTAWATWRRLRQAVDRFRSRRWPAVVAVVALVLLSTTAGPSRAVPEPLWTLSVGSDPVVVGAGHVYRLVTVGGYAEVVARRLADGTVTWRTRVATPGGSLSLDSGTLVLFDGDDGRLIGLDPATGMRWDVTGTPDSVIGSWIVLHRFGPSSGRWPWEWMTAVHARTGRIGEEVPLPADYVNAYLWEAPDGTPYVFTIDCGAWLVKHDLVAGREVARVRTRWDPFGEEPPCDEEGPWNRARGLSVGDNGVLVVREAGATGPVQTIYDAQTLSPLWTTTPIWNVDDCGPLVCLNDGRRLHAVEPHTGAVRWEVRCGPAALRCDFSGSMHAGRLWIPLTPPEGREVGNPPMQLVVDPLTGERLAGPTPWDVAAEASPDGHTLLLRIDDDRSYDPETGRTRTWWARSGPDLVNPQLLLEVTARSCQPALPYLACEDRGELTIWWVGEESA